MEQWIAYVDESVRLDVGAYLLAASCIEARDAEEARMSITTLVKPGERFNWRRSAAPVQAHAAGLVARLPVLHAVAVATPVSPRREERARRHCLQRLLHELDVLGVHDVTCEARTPRQDDKDTEAVDAFRAAKLISSSLKIEHRYPSGPAGEPLLWLAGHRRWRGRRGPWPRHPGASAAGHQDQLLPGDRQISAEPRP